MAFKLKGSEHWHGISKRRGRGSWRGSLLGLEFELCELLDFSGFQGGTSDGDVTGRHFIRPKVLSEIPGNTISPVRGLSPPRTPTEDLQAPRFVQRINSPNSWLDQSRFRARPSRSSSRSAPAPTSGKESTWQDSQRSCSGQNASLVPSLGPRPVRSPSSVLLSAADLTCGSGAPGSVGTCGGGGARKGGRGRERTRAQRAAQSS